ncbi:oxygenase MpaB family protein [Paraconexibacter sp.]|uniref:oxygenase MpaB family protein n=1 Tax=Paraconexibacter sp. TaxID=2949640 RepID=UPI003564CC5A
MSTPLTTQSLADRAGADGETWALGPGAVSWEVLRNPAVFVIALLREGLLLTLHPQFAAAAVDHDRVHQDPVTRYRTIARYAYSTVYGSRADAERVAGFVRRNHSRVVGVEPITGLPYQAHSAYELALTQALLSDSWIAAYELLVRPLSGSERDRFLQEQKLAGALLGIPPEHLPGTMAELQAFIAAATERWAAGLQAREILRPFTMGEYPQGSVIGDLPPLKRKAAARVIRALSDICLLTVRPRELELFSLPRRAELRAEWAVRASARALAAALGSARGTAAWDGFMKSDVAAIMRRARAAEAAAGGYDAASRSFVAPDPAPFVTAIDDLVPNMRPDVLEAITGATR